MNNKEAIAVLNMIECHGSLSQEAKDLAIKALEVCEKNAKYGSELARIVAEHDAADELMKKAEEERIYE